MFRRAFALTLVFISIPLFWVLCAALAEAQTLQFTYQGSLNDGASSANGAYDFQFKLFDALTGGTQTALPNTFSGVNVANGLFKVTLDFGTTTFSGANRWLEISVRPTGGGTYTTLNPRQPVTATPYAVKSLNAANADNLSAACVGCVTGAQIGALPTGSGNYIQNMTSPQSNSNFNISGTGTASILNATTQFNLLNTRVLSLGNRSLFVGEGAGAAITNALGNSFFGYSAGASTTSGSRNVFVGDYAGALNTTGSRNAYFGEAAGYENTVGTDNAFFGHGAGEFNTASGNAFFGAAAGSKNMAGSFNAFFGKDAGLENTSGSFNSFFGVRAGKSNTTGIENAFFGSAAGEANTIGQGNSFFGYGSGLSNIGGRYNAFFGELAGATNISGNGNSYFGGGAGNSSETGSDNTFIGTATGASNLSGTGNTLLGVSANVGANNLTNATAIGAYAQVDISNAIVLGDSTNTAFKAGIGTNTPSAKLDVNGGNSFARIAINSDTPIANAGIEFRLNNTKEWTIATANAQGDLIFFDESPGAGTRMQIVGGTGATGGFVGIGTTAPADKLQVIGDIRIGTGVFGCVKDADGTVIAGICSSDRRFKRDITPFPSLLDKLIKLQPVNFFWRSSEFPQRHFGDNQSYGLIAQEVEAVLPELVSTDAEGFKAVNYSKLPLLLLQGIKDQQLLSQQLKQENAGLKQQLTEQQLHLRRQEGEIEQLKRLICLSQPQADLCRSPK